MSSDESIRRICNLQLVYDVAHMFVVDASALLAVTVGAIAALPAYYCDAPIRPGPSASAIAFLSGLAAGMLAAVVLFEGFKR